MTSTPAAEVRIDLPLVRELLVEQHPDLAGLHLTIETSGWDNVIARLGPDLAVRLPRRAVAAELVRTEQRWLPQLAPRISTQIPVPRRVGHPNARYPWHWSVIPWVDGTTADDPDTAASVSIAGDLAGFLRQLHIAAPSDAPRNPVRGVPLEQRAEGVLARLASGRLEQSVQQVCDLKRIWADATGARDWSGAPRWLHGDLHPANLLVRSGRLAAVIDFGDLTSGDPATDLATAWLTFDPRARAVFRDALDAQYDDDTWLRARGWAALLGTVLAVQSDDSPQHRAMGRFAIEQVLGG